MGCMVQPCRVIFGREFQFVEDQRRDPSGAQLVARKGGAIDDQHIEAGVTQRPGTRRSCGPAANDHYIARVHSSRSDSSSKGAYRCSRVQTTNGLRLPANTTWNNCRFPARKAATDPAR